MDLGLKDKVFLVAAASKGLGLGVATVLAREGACVAIGSRTQADIEAAAATLRNATGARVLGYVLDAADPVSIELWIDNARRDFGRIDGLVVNAGGPPPGKFAAFDDAAWAGAFNLTLMSAVRMIRQALPDLQQNGGSILTISSTSIKEPLNNLVLSNVFRAGVASLVKSLVNEVGDKVRINNLMPGRFATDRVRSLYQRVAASTGASVDEVMADEVQAIPLRRNGQPIEFGEAAAFLLSDRASYITGASLVIDGGRTRAL